MTVALVCLTALGSVLGGVFSPGASPVVIEAVSDAESVTLSLVYLGPSSESEYRYEFSVRREHDGNLSDSRQSGSFVPSSDRTLLATSAVNLPSSGYVVAEARVWAPDGALLGEATLEL